MPPQDKKCIYCDQPSDLVPLINFSFKGSNYSICPQHLPILIHKPQMLADKIPGAENLSASDHSH